MLSYVGNSPAVQYLLGIDPDSWLAPTKAAVPNSLYNPIWKSSIKTLVAVCTNSMSSSGCATGTGVSPTETMALRFLLPITAPSPIRPAARPLSDIMLANLTKFSPAGPITRVAIRCSFIS